MIRIIGVGSPFGDDAAGLEAARRLAAAAPPDCEVVVADRPGVALVELLDGATAVIIIDAVRSGARPGTLHDLDLGTVVRGAPGAVSSHDLGVAAGLQLAARLGRAPARGRLLGIEAASRPALEPGLSPAVRRAARRAARRARDWAARYSANR